VREEEEEEKERERGHNHDDDDDDDDPRSWQVSILHHTIPTIPYLIPSLLPRRCSIHSIDPFLRCRSNWWAPTSTYPMHPAKENNGRENFIIIISNCSSPNKCHTLPWR